MSHPFVVQSSQTSISPPTGVETWEIWERENDDDGESLIYKGGENLSFEQLIPGAMAEIERFHREIGEGFPPPASYFLASSSDAVPAGARHVLYMPPTSTPRPNRFPLVLAHNGDDIRVQLAAYRKGFTPEDIERAEEAEAETRRLRQ